jgi:hypothetical protein
MANPFMMLNRRAIKSPSNPMDKATVVSIYPKEIVEHKHTLQPGQFIIPAGSFDKPGILVVGPSSWWREIDETQPLLEIPVGAILIAESVVKDYANGIIACNMNDMMPGIFFVPGELTEAELKKKHVTELVVAQTKQTKWYRKLVEMGDILWARSNGNPLAISDDMRLAAIELGVKDKAWMKDIQSYKMINWKACGTLINEQIIVCPNCKVVLNMEEFKKLNLSFAS